jgi:hypothetical protein
MRYLLIAMIFLFQGASGQSWYIKRSINWNIPIGNTANKPLEEILLFPFAEYDFSNGGLPVFSEVIKWQSDNENVSIKFFSEKYEVLPDALKDSAAFADLPENISIVNHVASASGHPYLTISFIPVRKNPSSGSIERLTEFVVEISSVSVDKSLKSFKKSFSGNSVLSSGEWYKVRIGASGIYKLTFDQLKAMGMTDPASLRIFGSGGNMLPEDIRKGQKDDLSPVGYYMNKGADGVFNQGDYILFYGLGTERWTYDTSLGIYVCQKNLYSDFGYYFLTCNNGLPDAVLNESPIMGEVNYTSSHYDYYTHYEKNEKNLISSGKDFYGEWFREGSFQHTIPFQIPGLLKTSAVKITGKVASRSSDSAFFNVSHGTTSIGSIPVRSTSLANYTAIHAYTQQKTFSFLSGSDNFDIKLQYSRRETNAEGWLDYLTIFAKAELSFANDLLHFRDFSSVGPGRISRFSIKNASGNTLIWDVTDANSILNIPGQLNQGTLSFDTETDRLREFVAFRVNGNFPSPEFTGEKLGRIENQNLHAISLADLLIITHEKFLAEAARLAQHRRDESGLIVNVTTVDKVFNEFSSGAPDVSAIRNFVKSVYDRGLTEGTPLRYLLLFGGGSYNNKGTVDDGNYVLTYQSDNSLSPVSSYVSDDFFALLDPGEQMFDGLLDLGVGRIPVFNNEQATVVVNKIIEYDSPSTMGTWRNSICFIGDDGDNNIHFTQSNQLANTVITRYPAFNVNKIFLDAYKKVSTPVGQRYPDVKTAINDQVARGALIMNYTGHGGVEGLAHERILEVNDINNWQNKGKYPLFMTATCEFTRFDDPSKLSAGELVFLNAESGGIALFTTTRLVYSGPNQVLNERFFEIVFSKDSNGSYYRLGDIMKYSKNNTGSGVNKRNFSIIGDPSMMLAYPKYSVSTDSINAIHISAPLDTMKALSEIKISGHLHDNTGAVLNNYNGILFPVIYDKAIQQNTLANDGGEKKTFSVQNNILYNGKVSVKNGYFNFKFIVPKDINYAFGGGKISYYAHDSLIDASGSFSDFTIGGSSSIFETDNTGPVLDVYMNNHNFRPGDITGPNPILYVKVKDESGINTTGNGIGHDISAVHNDNFVAPYILNSYFEADLDSYNSGTVTYPLFNLEEGNHRIAVKVWDIYNNSSEGFIDFVVAKSEELFLNEIFNYPNPFTEQTSFSFGHNRAGNDLDIRIEIFSLDGDLIKVIKSKEPHSGYRSEPIEWDGKSDGGAKMQQGLYVYRIHVSTSGGETAVKSGKLIILGY